MKTDSLPRALELTKKYREYSMFLKGAKNNYHNRTRVGQDWNIIIQASAISVVYPEKYTFEWCPSKAELEFIIKAAEAGLEAVRKELFELGMEEYAPAS